MHYVPGGSAFSGDYVVFCHQEPITVFLCPVTPWIEVDPRFSNQALQFTPTPPVSKRKLEPNLAKALWATSSTSSCNLPVCSQHLSGAPPPIPPLSFNALAAPIGDQTAACRQSPPKIQIRTCTRPRRLSPLSHLSWVGAGCHL